MTTKRATGKPGGCRLTAIGTACTLSAAGSVFLGTMFVGIMLRLGVVLLAGGLIASAAHRRRRQLARATTRVRTVCRRAVGWTLLAPTGATAVLVSGPMPFALGADESACVVRSKPIPTGPATLVAQRAVAGTDGRATELTLSSPALGGQTHVDIVVPRGYDGSGRTRYPVLYLLHGVGGSYADWTNHGLVQVVDDMRDQQQVQPFIAVMPDGGSFGFYTDWYGSDSYTGSSSQPPAWETYHIGELIPWIDAHYPTRAQRAGRAVAGLSMGGYGAMKYAAEHPELFVAAGSFSGAVDTDLNYPRTNEELDLSSGFRGALPDHCIWGDPNNQALRWRAADPTYLAGNLRGVSIYLASGNGNPGPLDSGGVGALPKERIEKFVWPMSQALDAALSDSNIPHVDDFYGNGTHDWPYWVRDLSHFLPQMDEAFGSGNPGYSPAAFDYRSASSNFTAWGWQFTAHRGAGEFTYLTNVNRSGLNVAGSGALSVRSASLYAPDAPVRVNVNGHSDTIRADAEGRVAFNIDLGAAHRHQQTDFRSDAAVRWQTANVQLTSLKTTSAPAPSVYRYRVEPAGDLTPSTGGESGNTAGKALTVGVLLGITWLARRPSRAYRRAAANSIFSAARSLSTWRAISRPSIGSAKWNSPGASASPQPSRRVPLRVSLSVNPASK